MSTLLASHLLGDILVEYRQPPGTSRCELHLLPADLQHRRATPREWIEDRVELARLPGFFLPLRARVPDSLVQLKLVGDPGGGGFSAGVTFQENPTVAGMKYGGQSVMTEGDRTFVTTLLIDGDERFRCLHRLAHYAGQPGVRCTTEFINTPTIRSRLSC